MTSPSFTACSWHFQLIINGILSAHFLSTLTSYYQSGAKEVYILGFDLSSYDEPLNNIYKGTDNYLSGDAKGFNPTNWVNQMQTVFTEYSKTQFYWVDAIHRKGEVTNVKNNNVRYLTKTDFCDTLKIL